MNLITNHDARHGFHRLGPGVEFAVRGQTEVVRVVRPVGETCDFTRYDSVAVCRVGDVWEDIDGYREMRTYSAD